MAPVLIGTSGWYYASWRRLLYPKGVPLKDQLRYYAGQFQTTDCNGVFYRTTTPGAVRNWPILFQFPRTLPSIDRKSAFEKAALKFRLTQSKLV